MWHNWSPLESHLRADSHSTIFVAYDGLAPFYGCDVHQRKCCCILKYVLKCCDSRKSCRRPVISLLHVPKSHLVNQP